MGEVGNMEQLFQEEQEQEHIPAHAHTLRNAHNGHDFLSADPAINTCEVAFPWRACHPGPYLSLS